MLKESTGSFKSEGTASMLAVILAAGRGIRMDHMTNDIPKCLLSINGETILQRQLRLLKQNRIGPLILVLGYQFEKVRAHLQEIGEEVTCVLNKDFENTNNMFSLNLTFDQVKGKEFLLMNGDCVFEEKVLSTVLETRDSVCPFDSDDFNPEELKVKVKDGKAFRIMPKKTGAEDSNGSTIGVFKFSKSASQALFEDMESVIGNGQRNEWFEYSLSRIFKDHHFTPLDVAGLKWCEIDDQNDLEMARKIFGTQMNAD